MDEKYLHTLRVAIPQGEGRVEDIPGLRGMRLEMWGACVATCRYGEKFVIDTEVVEDNNPDWLEDLTKIVDKLNAIPPPEVAAVRLNLTKVAAEWLAGFLAAPSLHREAEDEEMRRAVFHNLNNILHP